MDNTIFGRNSDFLVSIEKSYMNCLYQLSGVYAFNGNTTAFIQMEDGMNEYGLAIGLTFIYPLILSKMHCRVNMDLCVSMIEKRMQIQSGQSSMMLRIERFIGLKEIHREKSLK